MSCKIKKQKQNVSKVIRVVNAFTYKNKPRFDRDKPSKLISKLVRFNRV